MKFRIFGIYMGDSLLLGNKKNQKVTVNGQNGYQKEALLSRDDLFYQAGDKVKALIDSNLGEGAAVSLQWIKVKSSDDLSFDNNSFAGVANLQHMNDIAHINKMFEKANRLLPSGGVHLICFESMCQRKMRIMKKFPRLFNGIYYFFDFILKRVFPKWGPTRTITYWITGGRNRVISLTEGLGRLVSCGFEIIDYTETSGLTWVLTRKTDEPDYNPEPTFGAICRLKRIGYGGEMFTVYKLRTMYPFSEYLQDFIFKENDLQKGGKLNNDYRITSWGRWFRRFWLDELPMLYNWLKGDMKLVGVRPLSRHFYFDLYPKDLQLLRTKVKPGLVPPYYADMPETLAEIIESERNYIYSYLHKPIRTDVRYFVKAVWNILVCGARSR